MRRALLPLLAVLPLAACPTYDSAVYVRSERGLMPADEWAKYGESQAIVVATGRKFAEESVTAAADYAKGFTSVKSVETDSLGHRLVITFASGWRAQVNPITDGKKAESTRGLPAES